MESAGELELIRRAQAGDKVAYEELLRPVVVPAASLAFAMLHSHAESEDAFQEAAIRGWQRMANVRPGSSFQPWFLGIVANECREVRRSNRWRLLLPLDHLLERPVQGDAWLEGADLRRALDALPHRQRVAILMHFYLDMPISEVAVALGITAAGVKARINRGLRQLRPRLDLSEASQPNG
jgi:RNA polymerase sigma-70 factor (ECF subfamily)